MTMQTSCVKVLFIKTLNPELKPPPCTAHRLTEIQACRGLWLFLGRICGMINSSLLWRTEPPRSSPTRGLHLLNYPVFSLILWLTNIAPTVPHYPLVECLLVDSTLRLWCFTLHLLPPRLNNKIHPVRAMGTFLIIAAIIIMLVSQQCLSGLGGPVARWMGTQREKC